MSEKELAEIEKRWSSMGFSPGMAHLTTDIPCLIAEVRRLKFLLKDAQDGIEITSDLSWNAAIEAAAARFFGVDESRILSLKRPEGGSDEP